MGGKSLYSLIEFVYFARVMNRGSAALYVSFYLYPKATADGGKRAF